MIMPIKYLMISISEIKQKRKTIGITQKDLANESDVSQSMIAKIEAGILDPSYTNAIKIFDALNRLESKDALTAEDIMNKTVRSVTPDRSVPHIISLLKQNGFSQLPVIKDSVVLGIITEQSLLDSFSSPEKTAEEIMEDVPPIIPKTMSIDIIISLLHSYPLLLIKEKGKIKGVITKSDVLNIKKRE